MDGKPRKKSRKERKRAADKAEEEHIKMQPKIDRIKFAFVGTKLSIIRLILLFVPIGMLFLPLVHIKANIPFNSINYSLLSLVSAIYCICCKLFKAAHAIFCPHSSEEIISIKKNI